MYSNRIIGFVFGDHEKGREYKERGLVVVVVWFGGQLNN